MKQGLIYAFSGFAIVCVFAVVGWFGWSLQGNDLTAAEGDLSSERRVQVIFQSHVVGRLPVRFSPQERVQYVTPGVEHKNVYQFQNLSDETVYFTPIHAVAPSDAARNYSMSVCFCFYDQKMPPNSTAEFTLVYQLDPTISARTNPVFINYNLKPIEASQFRLKNPEHQPGAEIEVFPSSPLPSEGVEG